jgi:SAM-dependent methyltransferase
MTEGIAPSTAPIRPAQKTYFYYPDEGFGNLYRRVLTNDFFAELVRGTNIRSIAEVPLDSYGIVGAGSLIFTQLRREVTLISDDSAVLSRARLLMDFNGVQDVRYLLSGMGHLDVPDDAFDFTWSFDRLQILPDPQRFVRELCRVSKATMIMVPNACNYGQFAHHLYHRLNGTACDYVGPRAWMHQGPVEGALRQNGFAMVSSGFIDVPWWPEFPELPNLVRRALRRQPLVLDYDSTPEVNPQVVPDAEVARLRRRVRQSAFIELGPWPRLFKLLFAHNLYVIGCKPQYRRELGL